MAKMGRRKRSRLINSGALAPKGAASSAAAVEPKPAPAAKPAKLPKVSESKAKVSEPKAKASEPKAQAHPDIEALAERVKARRREKGWTQADVAKNGGPSAGAISQIERALNESPAAEILAKLDTALEWPADTCAAILRGTAPAELATAGR